MNEPSRVEWDGLTTEREYELWRTLYLHNTKRVLDENDRLRAQNNELLKYFIGCILYNTDFGPYYGGANCASDDYNYCECDDLNSDYIMILCEKCDVRNYPDDFIYVPKFTKFNGQQCINCETKKNLLLFVSCNRYPIYGPSMS